MQARLAAALLDPSVTVTGDLLALFSLQITRKLSASSAWMRFHLDLSPEEHNDVLLGVRRSFTFCTFKLNF